MHNKEGNEVYILLVALTYNILNWLKDSFYQRSLGLDVLSGLECTFLNLPAIIQGRKKQYSIKFSKFYLYKELFDYVLRELARGKP